MRAKLKKTTLIFNRLYLAKQAPVTGEVSWLREVTTNSASGADVPVACAAERVRRDSPHRKAVIWAAGAGRHVR